MTAREGPARCVVLGESGSEGDRGLREDRPARAGSGICCAWEGREIQLREAASRPGGAAPAQLDQAVAAGDAGVRVYPYALADRKGEDEFVVAVDLPAYSGLKIRTYDGPTRLERIRVDVRTLDGLFAVSDRLDYIKIDADGGDIGILRGATALLERFVPVVTFEFGANSLGSYGITVEDMAGFWRDKPYVIYDILGRELGPEQFMEAPSGRRCWTTWRCRNRVPRGSSTRGGLRAVAWPEGARRG